MNKITGNGLSIRKQVQLQPAAEQLEYAIYMLEELTGGVDHALAWWRETYKLTASEARVAAALNARAPRSVSKEALLLAANTDAELKIIDVYLCKIRKKLPFSIETVWGQGYAMIERVEVPDPAGPFSFARPMRGVKWTPENDQDLRSMFDSGSDISVMAEELDRTERAVLERIAFLGLRAGRTP